MNKTNQEETAKTEGSRRQKMTDEEKAEEMNKLLEYIRNNQGISLWALGKAVNIPNSSLYYKIRDLEFCGVIYTRLKTNPKNSKVRHVYTAKKKKELEKC